MLINYPRFKGSIWVGRFEMLIGDIIENKRRTVFRRGPPKSKGRPRNPDKHGRHTDGSRDWYEWRTLWIVNFQCDWSQLMFCTRKVQCVLYFECIYISSDKLKCSQVNCTMCTTPILSVPKHITSKMEGVNFEPVTILECVLTHFLNLSQHTWNCVKFMCHDTFL